MRKRHIKSVAHWVIMCFILLFPIVMVGISSFAQKQQEINVTETYEYQTNVVNTGDDLVVGNIYHLSLDNTYTSFNRVILTFKSYFNFNFNVENSNITSSLIGSLAIEQNQYLSLRYSSTGETLQIRINDNTTGYAYVSVTMSLNPTIDFDFVYQGFYDSTIIPYITASNYLGEKSIDYTITDQTMRDDVNEWCASFRNLPVNQWYGEMLDTIGLGITTSMMMNVIYTYPLYVLWVYIIDLLVDCLLVIINFGHNALKRLGGENE